MHKALRIGTIIILPIATLILGWQLGVSFEQKNIVELTEKLDLIYSGKTASGTILSNPEKEVDMSLFWGVWRLLIKHYINPENLRTPEMVFGAVGGMVDAIDDPYTSFMTPNENSEFHKSLQGELEGIGAELTLRDGMVVVVAPLKGSPAADAGLEPEDIIIEVDGKDIQGRPLHEVVQVIRGPKGTKVALKIIRKGVDEPFETQIIRASIKVPSVEYETKKTATGAIGYIELNQFGEDSVNEVKNALKDLRDENIKGLVLDVRFNGGGYLEGAVQIVSMFLREGKVVTVERREGEPVNHYVSGRPSDPDIPLAILINEGSASASEILAGALQDAKRAAVVGKTSFGKGTVQEVFDLPGNASVRITVAKWLTPSGKDLGKGGIIPDIEVERTREQISKNIDPQLERAMEYILEMKNE